MHHSSEPPGENSQLQDTLDAFMEKQAEELERAGDKLGATDEFPEGKLDPTDEGEIRFAVGVVDGKVVIQFGKPVSWLGMGADQAHDLGRLLMKNARKARK